MRLHASLTAVPADPLAAPARDAAGRLHLCRLLAAFLLLPAATSAESYRYDSVGRLIEVAYPDGTLLRYGYDENSNLLSGQVVGDAIFDNGFEP